MISMAGNKDFKPILSALRDQDWEITQTTQGHYRARPPDPTKPIVHLSTSYDPRALKNTIQELKKSGFVWPPPPKSRPSEVAPDSEAFWNQMDLGPESEPTPSAPVVVEAHEDKMERLWNELKEAKTWFALTDDTMRIAQEQLALAQKAFDEATAERTKAAESLKTKKAEFDSAFNEGVAAA